VRALGIRTSAKSIRYAIVEERADGLVLVNSASESRLLFPATMTNFEDRLVWLASEVNRLISHHGPFDRVCVKHSEFTRAGATLAGRESAGLDATVLLVARQHQLPAERILYTPLGSRRDDAKTDAEARVGRTTKYWDIAMADAVLAATHGFNP
jgi:hypothetical protein